MYRSYRLYFQVLFYFIFKSTGKILFCIWVNCMTKANLSFIIDSQTMKVGKIRDQYCLHVLFKQHHGAYDNKFVIHFCLLRSSSFSIRNWCLPQVPSLIGSLWLTRLHFFNAFQEFKCEICGNYSYWGRRAFERHFKEWRHQHGMRCLGIPNTKNFNEITSIEVCFTELFYPLHLFVSLMSSSAQQSLPTVVLIMASVC